MTNPTHSIRLTDNLKALICLAAVLALLLAISCGDDPVGPEDTTAPTVDSTSPAQGDTGVDVETQVVITFSEAIRASTVDQLSVYVAGYASDDIVVVGATVTLTPSSSLAYGEEHTLWITNSVTDLAGNKLNQDYQISFRTEVDPATIPPVVIATNPTSGATQVDAAAPIGVIFDKIMDPASFGAGSITLNNGATGTISVIDSTATFTPDDTLLFETSYTATVDTTVTDTNGNKLAESYQWSFTTGSDPLIPWAGIEFPYHNQIIGDSTTVLISTAHPVGVTAVEFYIDGVHQSGADDSTAPFEYIWDASGYEIGSEHTVSAIAHEAGGRIGYSDTATFIYQWEELLATVDNPDDWEVDIRMVYARSTDSLLEFRFQMWEDWSSDPINDTALDCGIYLDTDRSSATGRTTVFLTPPQLLNGMGADYMLIVGLHGLDALREYNDGSETWETIYDPTGFEYINLPPDTNIFEVGLKWSDIGSPGSLRMVAINVFFFDSVAFLGDWVPDQGAGYINIAHEDRYIGEGYTEAAAPYGPPMPNRSSAYPNPFSESLSAER